MSTSEGVALLGIAVVLAVLTALIARGHTSLIAGVGPNTPENVDGAELGKGFALRLSPAVVGTFALAALEFAGGTNSAAWIAYVVLLLATTVWTVSYTRQFDV
ncbi:hypothetical protein [Salarchaeum japonicum]|uniref:hypothetical protein n=1 Tax=Salarchaeum japonicum TaxID=555573 RepID=UPI003C71AF88